MHTKKFYVRIRLDNVRRRLAATGRGRRRPVCNDDAFCWLLQNGFRLTRGGWHAGLEQVALLAEGEILIRQRIP